MIVKKNLYEQLISDDNLTEAWHHVRRGGTAPGSDGESIDQFNRRQFRNMKALQEDLACHNYHPQPVKRFKVAKPSGGHRMVGILTVRDRLVQRAALQVIEPLFDPHFEDFSFGFRVGRSTQQAIDRLSERINQGLSWVVHLDIQSFFDKINVGRLYGLMKRVVHNRAVLQLMRGWLQEQSLGVSREGLFQRSIRRGVLQGGVLSPLWANVYLDRFDKRALHSGLRVIRYADDIVLLCVTQTDANAALNAATHLLGALELDLNMSKTRIVHAPDGVIFLGQTVTLDASIPKENSVDGAEAIDVDASLWDDGFDDAQATVLTGRV